MAGASLNRVLMSVTAVVFLGCTVYSNAEAQGQSNQGASPGGRRSPDGTQSLDTARPIYLAGIVRLPDGSVPPASVIVERVCGGVVRPEGNTDSNGRFSFIMGNQHSGVFMDASVAGDSPSRAPTRQRNELAGCEMRANLAGFISDSIVLGFRQAGDNPNIGTIHIRPLENVQGFTFSATTAAAPKEAQKAYEKGVDQAKKEKWANAEREFLKAVQVYPKYAVAWCELGMAYHKQHKDGEARSAYLQALQIDSKYITPYGQLVALNAAQHSWQELDENSSQMLKLNPYVGPEIYLYAAVANYNLHKMTIAEERAREAVKLDPEHKIPKINQLLGLILRQKHDYDGARENIQIYLKFSPAAPDAEEAKQLLADLDKEAAAR